MINLLVIGLVLIISACQTFTVNPVHPEPEIILLGISPGLRPLNEAVDYCAEDLGNTIVVTNVMPVSLQSFDEFDVLIHLESLLSNISENVFVVGMEDIVVITNISAKGKAMNIGEIQNLFTTASATNQVYVYDEANEIRFIFDNTVLSKLALTSEAIIVPHPDGMLDTILETMNSVGYVPNAWLQFDPSGKLSKLNVIGEIATVPILVSTKYPPEEALKSLIVCLQTGKGEEEILKLYKKD